MRFCFSHVQQNNFSKRLFYIYIVNVSLLQIQTTRYYSNSITKLIINLRKKKWINHGVISLKVQMDLANCRMCPENSVTSEGAIGMANYKVYPKIQENTVTSDILLRV